MKNKARKIDYPVLPIEDENYKFTPNEWAIFIVFLSFLLDKKHQHFVKHYQGTALNAKHSELHSSLVKALKVFSAHSYYFI